MKAIDFCYKLQGFVEISNVVPSDEQLLVILNLLDEVELEKPTSKTSMDPNNFVVWMRGWKEIVQPSSIDDTAWVVIQDHLQAVFLKVTPDRSKKQDAEIEEIEVTQNDIDDWIRKINERKKDYPDWPKPKCSPTLCSSSNSLKAC